MNPTLQQLDRWLDAHNMEANISHDDIAITLYAGTMISHRITWQRTKGCKLDEAGRLNEACAMMARECCLVPPLVALHLNKS
jgi:hypothetical protein